MPSKKRKYNARFPPGRIKKIMQTDEEVGKVAQAVPIIISRTLELFVESLLSKAMQVTMSRSARTLSPSHVKQCILSEARFDFLRDLVKNIPDVSAAEEKEMVSAESSPNSSRFSDVSAPPRRILREDSNSSSSCDIKPPPPLSRTLSDVGEPCRSQRSDAVTSAAVNPSDVIIDLSIKSETNTRPVLTPNFYQETMLTDDPPTRSVITLNPTYTCQPSTSSYANLTPVEPMHRIEIPAPNDKPLFYIGQNNNNQTPGSPQPVAPILNIDFSKNLAIPEIKVLDSSVASIVPPKVDKPKSLQRQNSRPKPEIKKFEPKPVNIEYVSENLQIDEDYDT